MNITDTIDPKVDQLTADHLIGRSLTIRVTAVKLNGGDQPCDIHYEQDGGLPYRPGKSMRRVLVHVWGGDVNKYVGRSMRLYRDDDVQFGGLKVGGIRISHMSHIDSPQTLALTAKKGSKKAFKVLPLVEEKKADKAAELKERVLSLIDRIEGADSIEALQGITSDPAVVKLRGWLAENWTGPAGDVDGAVEAALARLAPPADAADDFPGDRPMEAAE